jgi:hypothetical protein
VRRPALSSPHEGAVTCYAIAFEIGSARFQPRICPPLSAAPATSEGSEIGLALTH